MRVEVAPGWLEAFPGAHVGLVCLADRVNPGTHAALQERVRDIEATLRRQYAGMQRSDLAGLSVVQAYQRHYHGFGQTYHVLRQLESLTLKGRSLSSPSALVLAMFAAELQSMLLTAAHDVDTLEPPIVLDASRAGDRFVGIGGHEHVVRGGDMLMRDGDGIISAVVYGPDQRTRLTEATQSALFTTYAPAGIEPLQVEQHLEQLVQLVRVAAPDARTTLQAIYP
jgi:DNA/RNA-binding domain of Phe-tRNA-synthetase-like protein